MDSEHKFSVDICKGFCNIVLCVVEKENIKMPRGKGVKKRKFNAFLALSSGSSDDGCPTSEEPKSKVRQLNLF